MNKMQAYLLLIFLSSAVCGATTFPLGTYSYLGNKEHVYDNRDEFTDYMQDLGYNTNIIEIFSPGSAAYSSYDDLYVKLSDKGIKAIVMDKRSNEAYSSYGLSTGSYQRFEAEYKDGSAVGEGDNLVSKYWYRSNSDTQERVGQLFIPDNRFWLCLKDSIPDGGFAYTDLKYRWNTVGGDSIRIGKEFYIKKLNSPDTSNYLYITYKFNISNVDSGINVSTPLLAFMPCGYPYLDGGHASAPEYLTHEGNPPNAITTYYRLEDFNNSGSLDGTVTHTIKIKYSDLLSHNLMVDGSSMRTLVNLNPRLYWYANCDLKLDYIEFEDQLFHDMKEVDGSGNIVLNPVYQGGLTTGISSLFPSVYTDVVSGLYTLDEPRQGQWKAYKMIQDEVPYSLDCMTASYDWQYNKFRLYGTTEPNSKYYNHIDAFRTVAQPKITMPDIYPLRPENEYVDWNSENGLQKIIDNKVVEVYQAAKEYVSGHPDRKFYPVVQAFGYWNKDEWSSWILPPPEMQKMLQYLPLCFDPDGIFNYRLFGYQTYSNNGNVVRRGDYAALYSSKFVTDVTKLVNPTDDSIRFGEDGESRASYGAPVIHNSTYNAIKEANQKVLKYAELIKGTDDLSSRLVWNGSNVIGLTWNEGASFLANMHLADIIVDYVGNDTNYQGYVQCGYYLDSLGNPSFMVVNRRANYFQSTTYDSPRYVPVAQYSSCYPAFDAQTLLFGLNPDSYATYGTFPALYDSADEHIYISGDQDINVCLGAGDGKLLQMCSSLPASVTGDADVKSIAYLSGSITIDQGAVVTIHPGTETKIFAHSSILVKGGSTLNISGTVEIADSVSIIVEDGSAIVFNNATCNWGDNSILLVDDSGITATNTILKKTDDGETWQGMRISNAGIVTMTNTTISGADYNEVLGSQVLLADCLFNVPTNGVGLSIANKLPGQSIRITASTDNKGFYGAGTDNIGLYYDNPYANLFLHGVVFEDLWLGLANGSNPALGDTIRYCHFNKNSTGMHFIGLQYSPLIRNCTFFKNDLGAYFEVTSPKVVECDFTSCDIGIRTELSTAQSGGIFDSTFSLGDIGIESRGSNQRVAYNKFYTDTGILNHAGSILNMGNAAKNLYQAEYENLKFQDTSSYTARVQLYGGHNDFYHKNPGPFNLSLDFHFDANWDVGGLFKSPINASYNWFEDSVAKISSPGTPSDYAYCNYYDPSPNVYLENNERMAQAMSAELAGNYLTANDTYKTILNENEISEAELLYDALDAYYRTADQAGVTLTGTESYLLAKIAQYDTDNPILTKYLQDYLIKNCLQAEAFQTAIDLLELRILNAESPVDSLHAVMNLEIVLQLAAMSENKKPISTKYTQYIYPDRNVFKAKHQEHWDLLDELLNGTEEDMIPIPNKALISSNYPNPFNPSTTIAFSIPKDGLVKVGIYNVKGQKVKDLCDSEMLRGFHKVVWDGKDKHQRDVSSGIYFVKMQASGAIPTRKIMLMK